MKGLAAFGAYCFPYHFLVVAFLYVSSANGASTTTSAVPPPPESSSSTHLRGGNLRTLQDEALNTNLRNSPLAEITLFDASTNHPILTVHDQDVLSMSTIRATDLTVVAQPATSLSTTPFNDDGIEFIKFAFDSQEQVEYAAPYVMGGNDGDVYRPVPWLATPGQKTIVINTKTHDAPNAMTETITFTVADDDADDVDAVIQVVPPVAPLIPTAAPVDVVVPVPTPVVIETGPMISPVEGVTLTGELKTWHKLTLTFAGGPFLYETSNPNPFTDYRLDVTFFNAMVADESKRTFVVPGYFAADGEAADTSAEAGNLWRVHFSPPATGRWTYKARFVTGPNVAMAWPDQVVGTPTAFDGVTGTFTVRETDKTGRDLRGKGLLEYVGQHHLRFAGTGEWFLKCGSDSPENFLAYEDIDNTGIRPWSMKTWEPHLQDYRTGDPTWGDGKGSAIIGAVNYLADQGMNAFSFLTMSLEGDDKNVYPYISETEFYRMDVSKLAQWEVVFEHADHRGMFMHFKTQETENDQLLDEGELGDTRKLYYRELIAVSTAVKKSLESYFSHLSLFNISVSVTTWP